MRVVVTDEDEVEDLELQLAKALKEDGAFYAKALDGDVYVEWQLTRLLEFCQDWRSEIEDLG